MHRGEGLSSTGQRRIDGAVRNAERSSGLSFAVYVGAAGADPRAYAARLPATLHRDES